LKISVLNRIHKISEKSCLVFIFALMIFAITSLNPITAFADTTEWNSEILVGILESENIENGINVKVSTISNNGLKIEWSEPNLTENLLVTGYQILRKTLDNKHTERLTQTLETDTQH